MSKRLDAVRHLPLAVLRRCYSRVLARCGPHDADDLVQDGHVFLIYRDRMWPEMPEQEFLERCEANLILFYRTLYRRRFGAARPRREEETGYDLSRVYDKPVPARESMLDFLPARLAVPIRRLIVDGLTGDEVAAELKVTRATVYNRVRRGLYILREALTDE